MAALRRYSGQESFYHTLSRSSAFFDRASAAGADSAPEMRSPLFPDIERAGALGVRSELQERMDAKTAMQLGGVVTAVIRKYQRES